MPRCIFCRKEHDKLTDEHIFMAAIGGTLTVDGSCKTCNNILNKAFEEKIAKRLIHFRRVLRLPDRYGELPMIDVKVNVNGEEVAGWLLQDGSTVIKPRVRTIHKDGVKEIIGEYLPPETKAEWRRQAEEKGGEFSEEFVPGGVGDGNFSGSLDFINETEMLRTVAKIAYTALVRRIGGVSAMSDTFDNLREFVRSGAGQPKVRLFLNEEVMAECFMGPHQHSVVLVGRNDTHRVDAVVRLFGGISYHVSLSENYGGADFYDTLVFNSQAQEINGSLVTDIMAEFNLMDAILHSPNTVWDDGIKSGEWFLHYLDRIISQKPTGG
jgi:hypothetical protein